ncbi:hypothetical protein Aspvir_009677 [Aspergillus viridinutans]|uniref:Uncharacterized protein n=1 Tax=Aspergillus viridinutans TaxID=75553 RepID=A0A9P3F572_ASPVI|nr:uncharacterized protein Aspvir_009677 [Aspergillus viridinutans]GIK05564.1 hypothetical protein Aspvir_009677 [Aspergillus viridinutans]
MIYPWKVLSSWAPFKIDALGLVTLLGADEVNTSVGRLAPSYWMEFMPLLAGFVFAGDRFRSKQASFTLYNVSSGIVTGNIASWFTRWMQTQDFERSRSLVYWEVQAIPRKSWGNFIVAVIISFAVTGLLIAMTILASDWYGFANATALVFLTAVRSYLLQSHRNAIDREVKAARPLPTTFAGALEEWEKNIKNDRSAPKPEKDSRKWRPELVKVLIDLPDSRLVTMFMPEHLIRPVFVTDTTPSSPWVYRLAQWVGWVAFCVHIVTLGMAQLATQLYVVVIMVLSTVLICYGFGCDDSTLYKWWHQARYGDAPSSYSCWVGTYLRATVSEWPSDFEFVRGKDGAWSRRLASDFLKREQRSTARQDLYAWLDLSPEEMRSMSDWHLLPHRRDHDDSWWTDFAAKRLLVQRNPLDISLLKEQKEHHSRMGERKDEDLDCRFSQCGDMEKGNSNNHSSIRCR